MTEENFKRSSNTQALQGQKGSDFDLIQHGIYENNCIVFEHFVEWAL